MVGEHCIFDRDAVLNDTIGTEHVPDILEDFDDFEDMYDIDHWEDITDEEDVVIELEDIRESQNPILALMQNMQKSPVVEDVEINIEMLKIDDADDGPTIESIYSLERVQEIYMGVTDLSEFQEFYEVYTRDFMELEENRASRLNFLKQLRLAWFNIPSTSNKRGGT